MVSFAEIARKINDKIVENWVAQGHDLTGAMVQSLNEPDSIKVMIEGDNTVIEGYARHYWRYINFGVKPEQIIYPFAEARIKGLTSYAELRMGLTGDDAVSAAFGIATKHKKEGFPMPYKQFTIRTKFVEKAFEQVDEIEIAIDKIIGEQIDKEIKL